MKKFIKPSKDELLKDQEIFKKKKFNFTSPSPEDKRDFVATIVSPEVTEVFPDEYEAPATEILNQGSIGSCVAHACSSAISSGEEVFKDSHDEYSRGYIYANRRDSDATGEGMVIRQALKQLNKCGDVYQKDFPYNKTYPQVRKLLEENKEELAEKALPHTIYNYYRCYTEAEIKRTIMNAGGVVICVPVYSDFARDLHVTKTGELDGYHALIIKGWTSDGKWIVQNSWGKTWGYDGYLLMDKDYPVDEYWGITIHEFGPNDPVKKDCIIKRAIFAVGRFIKKVIDWWVAFFKQSK